MVAHSGLITVMQRAARKAAPRLRRDFGEVEQLQVSRKGPADFVSMADKRSEQRSSRSSYARPDWGMLLEEGGEIEGNPDKPRWIVDPLDGTTNFLHGVPHFSISIAVEEKKPGGGTEITQGLVYQPLTDDSYLGGEGPRRMASGRAPARIRPARSRRQPDRHRNSAFSAAATRRNGRKSTPPSLRSVAGIRRFGSAALDLAWVAAGRMDGFWEDDLDLWDTAAGVLLVRKRVAS